MDVLNISANERVDLSDLQYASFDSQLGFTRQNNQQLMTPNSQMWVLQGFAQSKSGFQVSVTLGSAMLAYRVGTIVNYGVICAEGDSVKTLDLSSFTPGTYGIYIRFNYIPSAYQSRVFWNAGGTGSEYARTTPTRQSAAWELRIEVANPGAEWLQIGQASISGGVLTLTDQRPFYFEGRADTTYGNTWGAGNDRNANRATYGVHDFQTFTAAMRTCLEDLKGQGLRRWWDPVIGGQNINFSGSPVAGRTAWGDAGFYAQGDTNVPTLVFGGTSTGTYQYNRISNVWNWILGGSTRVTLNAQGIGVGVAPINALDVTGGIAVGTYAGSTTVASGVVSASTGMSVGVNAPATGDAATFAQTSAASGYTGITAQNLVGVGGAYMRLRNAARYWDLRVSVANSFELVDQTGTTTRMSMSTAGAGYVNGTLNVGTNGLAASSTFQVNAGTLSGASTTILESTRYVHSDSNTDALRFFGYRASSGGDWTTADTYMGRIVDTTPNGFVAFYGSASTSTYAAGVGLGFGAPGGLPALYVHSSNNYVGVNTGGSTYLATADTTVPLQIGGISGGSTFFGANKASALGMLLGYGVSYTMTYNTVVSGANATTTGPLTGGMLRQITTDPLYFAANNNVVAGFITSASQWWFGSQATAPAGAGNPSAVVNIRSSSTQTYLSLVGDPGVSQDCIAYMGAFGGTYNAYWTYANSGTSYWKQGGGAGTFFLTDVLNNKTVFSYSNTTKYIDFTNISAMITPQLYIKGDDGVGYFAAPNIYVYGSVYDAVATGGTLTPSDSGVLFGNGMTLWIPLRIPRNCTVNSYGVGVNYAAGGTSGQTTSVTVSLWRRQNNNTLALLMDTAATGPSIIGPSPASGGGTINGTSSLNLPSGGTGAGDAVYYIKVTNTNTYGITMNLYSVYAYVTPLSVSAGVRG